MLNITICDDDLDVCIKIERAVKNFGKEQGIPISVSTFSDGEKLIKYLATNRNVNLIFLDILLQTQNGMEVAKHIRDVLKNQMVQIVYISNLKTLSPQVFECNPMDFLPKPIADEKILIEIKKCIELSKSSVRTFSYKKIGGEVYNRSLDEIIYFESLDRQMKIVCTSGGEYFYSRMKLIFDELKEHGFSYIHRSYIVNIKHITKCTREYVVMSNGDKLPVSKSMSKELKLSLIK